MKYLFDLHQDLPTYLNTNGLGELIGKYTPFEKEDPARHGDLPSFKKANLKLLVASFFPFKREDKKMIPQSKKEFQKSLEEFKKFLVDHPVLKIIKGASQLEEIKHSPKIGLIYHLEGLYLVKKPQDVRWLYSLGFRSFGLAWNFPSRICGHCRQEKGLSSFGRKIIRELLSKNLIIDLTHASQKTFWDVLQIKKTSQIYYSHSFLQEGEGAHPQAITEKMLESLKENKGVLGLTLLPDINSGLDFEVWKEKILELTEKKFEDCLCLGSDYFGFSFKKSPSGLENIQYLTRLHRSLSESSSQETADKIFFQNALGFLNRNL